MTPEEMTIGQQVDAILKWQSDDKVHPLTCNCQSIDNNEKKFDSIRVSLDNEISIECSKCGIVQEWIPESVLEYWCTAQIYDKLETPEESNIDKPKDLYIAQALMETWRAEKSKDTEYSKTVSLSAYLEFNYNIRYVALCNRLGISPQPLSRWLTKRISEVI